jgi:hypothetical protein
MRKVSKPNQDSSRDKKIKKRAQICANSISMNLHRMNSEILEELVDEDSDVKKFARRKQKALNYIKDYLAQFLTQWDDNQVDDDSVFGYWEYYADVVYYSQFSNSRNETNRLPVEEIIEQVKYLNESVRAGRLTTMPGVSLEASRGYRGYISANLFSGKMGWDWKNWSENDLTIADHLVAELATDSVTAVFDKFQLTNETGFVGLFASFLIQDWDASKQRQKLVKKVK